jgi:hypothetical protein
MRLLEWLRRCRSTVEHGSMTRPAVLLAIALLGFAAGACGGAGKGTTSARSGAGARSGSSSEAQRYETFGLMASRVDARAITTIVRRYYTAAAGGRGNVACSLLYSPMAGAVAEDYGHLPSAPELRAGTCAEVMSKLFKHRRGQPTGDLAGIRVTGVRVSGNEGIALWRSPETAHGEISVERLPGGAWQIKELLGKALS